MSTPDATNELFFLAAELVNHTAQHIFLTGKAGTGKTTFLRYIRGETYKKMAVVAPTGVAAINAGGVTMHSFFNLPFEPFVPVRQFNSGSVANKNNLFSKVQLSRVKREVMEELELLVIDEVSMMRCDKLDAIDTILRGVRRSNVPFGGVQVLFIGDMYQLPPVTTDDEWQILKEYYDSPFFFDAHVIKEIDLSYVELKKIYRQKEQRFIDLLNAIRHNSATEDDLYLLHSRYRPDYTENDGSHSITITTHNFKADQINAYELKKIKAHEYTFKGEIDGEFSDRALPTDLHLILKEGAQIMFIKNDTGEDKAYYNGKLAVVKDISREEIVVTMLEGGNEFTLKKEVWQNIRYSLQKETGRIEEDVLGTFKQFPIRLAWAITIHKSQGLTFERVIIDAGQSFAAGQVYVALSRCTTLDGMTLLSRIGPQAIATDERIVAFSRREQEVAALQDTLEKEKRIFLAQRILKSFQFSKVINALDAYLEFIPEKNIPEKEATIKMAEQLVAQSNELQVVAEKFCEQLKKILADGAPDTTVLRDRVTKGIFWFADAYKNNILDPLHKHLEHLQHASKVRQYVKFVSETYQYCEQHLRQLLLLQYDGIRFIEDEALAMSYIPSGSIEKVKTKNKKEKTKRPTKGESQHLTLELFKQGKTIEQVAGERNLAVSTIEGHLCQYISTGEIDILELMPAARYNQILAAIDELKSAEMSHLRQYFAETISYGQLKAALTAREKELSEG